MSLLDAVRLYQCTLCGATTYSDGRPNAVCGCRIPRWRLVLSRQRVQRGVPGAIPQRRSREAARAYGQAYRRRHPNAYHRPCPKCGQPMMRHSAQCRACYTLVVHSEGSAAARKSA